MNKLIPTPRVDKNGRTVIRHMKADEAPAKAPAIPAVTMPKQTPKGRVEDVAALLIQHGKTSMDSPDMAMYLRYLDDDNETTLPLFKRLLSTGEPEAQGVVARFLNETLEAIKEAGNDSYDPFDEDGEDYEEHWNWHDNCPEVWFPTSSHAALRLWNAVTVMNESGYTGDKNDIYYAISEMEMSLPEMDPRDNKESLTNRYWRGTVALAVGGMNIKREDSENRERIPEFISWAGRHDDIATVIRTVQERKTIDTQMLEEIIAEKYSTVAAVREGVL